MNRDDFTRQGLISEQNTKKTFSSFYGFDRKKQQEENAIELTNFEERPNYANYVSIDDIGTRE
jgi:hypothetical protein